MLYHAFISYSHAADERLAPAIQSGLHRLARPFYRRRALNVFRDKTGLAATPTLWSTIEAALEQSAHFILLASPESAKSEWVSKEVAWWLDHRSIETLLFVLTGGELMWNATVRDFDQAHASAIPEVLHGKLGEEPLYVDLRWAHSPGELTLRNARFLDAILDLAAPLHGKAKNDLAGEDVRQSRIVRSLSIAVAFTLAVLAGAAWYQRSLAVERQRLAEQRLKELCEAWKVTTTFMEENFPAAIYDIKSRLHDTFAFDETCRP